MSNIQKPPRIPTPFAEDGLRNEIPLTGVVPGLASWSKGWDNINSEELEEGGIPPSRLDFNALFNIITQHLVYQQKGGFPTWEAEENYSPPAIVQGNNGLLYQAKDDSGPDTDAGAKSPIDEDNGDYWYNITFNEDISGLLANIENIQNSLTMLEQQLAAVGGTIWQPVDATTSIKGIVEFATDAEAKAASLDNKALSPANLLGLVIAGGGGGGGGGTLKSRTFTASGTWTAPSDGAILIHLVHGGGGGGAGSHGNVCSGGGGGGGFGGSGGTGTVGAKTMPSDPYVSGGSAGTAGGGSTGGKGGGGAERGTSGGGGSGGRDLLFAQVTKDTTYTVTVGAGGNGGTATSSGYRISAGTGGGKSSVGIEELVYVSFNNGGAGGNGGGSSAGDVGTAANGGYGGAGGVAMYGSGGGGGNGGGAGGDRGKAGSPGTKPGAGGGAGGGYSGGDINSTTATNGGSGYRGEVTIYYTDGGEDTGGGAFSNSRTFSSSSTWTAPSDGLIMIQRIHGGGGGAWYGSMDWDDCWGGNGGGVASLGVGTVGAVGGKGGYGGCSTNFATVVKDTTYTITIGAGGATHWRGGDPGGVTSTNIPYHYPGIVSQLQYTNNSAGQGGAAGGHTATSKPGNDGQVTIWW